MLKKTRNLLKESHNETAILKMIIGFVIMIGIVIGIGKMYEIDLWGQLVLLGFTVFLLPMCFYWMLYAKNEKKKYMDITVYMEQMICSFKRSGNVMSSLEDCLALYLPKEKMHQILTNAVKMRKTGEGVTLGKNLSREAFAVIENEYKSRRLVLLHDFIAKSETAGGERDHELDLQLHDTQEWKKRTRKFRTRRNNIKIEIIIATVMSALLCYSTKAMTPDSLGINLSTLPSYQIVTVFVFLCFGLFLYLTQKLLSGTWLDEKTVNEKYNRILMHRYQFVNNYTTKNNIVENLPFIIVGVILALTLLILSVLYFSGWFRVAGGIGVALLCMYIIYSCINTKMRYIRFVCKEVEKEFPYFLMGVTLLLQSESLYNAIKIACEDTQSVMKIELNKMLEQLYKDPNSMKAFSDFFKNFDIEETKSGMKLLYSVNINGYEGLERQLDFLSEQNNEMMGQAEEIRFTNQIAGLGLVKQVPILLGILKLTVDLVNVLFCVTNTMSNML